MALETNPGKQKRVYSIPDLVRDGYRGEVPGNSFLSLSNRFGSVPSTKPSPLNKNAWSASPLSFIRFASASSARRFFALARRHSIPSASTLPCFLNERRRWTRMISGHRRSRFKTFQTKKDLYADLGL